MQDADVINPVIMIIQLKKHDVNTKVICITDCIEVPLDNILSICKDQTFLIKDIGYDYDLSCCFLELSNGEVIFFGLPLN